MGRDDGRPWVFAERWPALLVAPAFYVGGYTWLQVIALTALVAVLAEVIFAVVRTLLLDREY